MSPSMSNIAAWSTRGRYPGAATSPSGARGRRSEGEQAAEPVRAGGDGGLRDPGSGDDPVEAVVATGPHVQLGDATGQPDALGIGDVLGAERVRRPDVDERRR